jgi:hypothetical protein
MPDLTKGRLDALLRYDPLLGEFYRLTAYTNQYGAVGRRVGSLSSQGYIVTPIDGRMYRAHRLAFLTMTGIWPPHQVDHVNGVRHDNRWSNLRLATHSQNKHNERRPADNSSGFKGVSWHKGAGKWSAQAVLSGRKHHLGLFVSTADAAAAYDAFAERNYGPFALTNGELRRRGGAYAATA